MNLTFYEGLSPDQKRFADLIAERARAAGVPPELAVAVAYQESRLNPGVARGSSGEIGIMQVRPNTGRDLGFSAKDLENPESNIDAGIAYLKRSLAAAEGNRKLAVVGYNAGINHPFFSGGELPETTKKYVQNLDSMGAFTGQEAAAPVAPESEPAAPAEDPAVQMEQRLTAAKDEQEQRMAQMIGGGVGAGMALTRGVQDVGGAVGRAVGSGFSRMMPQTPGTPPPMAPGADQVTRILQGTTEDGLTGRARSTGFNVTSAQEAARADEAKRIIGALQQRGVAPQTAQQVFAAAPGLTSTPSGVLVPRTINVPPTTAPAKPSGLEQVTKMFAAMAEPAARIAAPVMRYGAPPLALAQAGGEGMRAFQGATKPTPDYLDVGLSGLGALGAGLSAFPGTAPVGLPMAVGSPVLRDILSKVRAQQAAAAANPPAPLTSEEEARLSRPAFGIYPSAGRRGTSEPSRDTLGY